MSNYQLKTPVVFIIFNRPDTTNKVFAEIAKARPPKLLVIADGPRVDHSEEKEKCDAVRAIIDNVDWDCEVLTNYSEVNMGCKNRISSGLSWVFNTVEEAIILEDDCLPHSTFFSFCEEMLSKYRDDDRIGMISGNNFQFGKKRTDYSYYFSRYPHIWGWASWKRVWDNYDGNMKTWPEVRDGKWLEDILETKRSVWYWKYTFNKVYKGKIDTWDYQLTFSFWTQNRLTIIPNVNLVSNIGFNQEAVHTKVKNKFADIETRSMNKPILHPPYILCDSKADEFVEKIMFSGNYLIIRIIHRTISNFKNSLTNHKKVK